MKLTANKLLVILGPTASGKTALAHSLASVFGGEIVNADSRQIYKELTIGTAKPDYKHSGIPYHLFDIIDPDKEFSVAEYKKLATAVIDNIHQRGKLPFLVGGTGLYIKSIVDNLQIPAVPPQKALRTQWEKQSANDLYDKLMQLDPLTAKTIDRHNKRRLIRALEVTLASGKSFFGQTKKGSRPYRTLQIALDIPKEKLLENIQERTKKMIDNGLENEVRGLISKHSWNNLLLSTIGYKEWKNYFNGQKTVEQVQEDIIKNTGLLVKKQLTWFRAQKDIHWVKNKEGSKELIEKFLQ